MTNPTLVSLFDGIAGFPLAFERAGVETVATVEIDPAAAAVSAKHFPHATQFDDVTKVTGDDLRAVGFVPERGIICAGWPCQDFSVAGRRAGLAGARSGLWWEVVRILAETRPRWFVGENVPGLLSSVCDPECEGGCMRSHGGAMGSILRSLAELGYGYAYRILDAQHFGVPQRRHRVFVVGHLGEPFGAATEILFEPESSAGDSAESGAAGAGVAASAAGCVGEPRVTTVTGTTHTHTLTVGSSPGCVNEDGTGRGNPVVAIEHTHTQRCRRCRRPDTASTPSQQQGGYPCVVQPLAIRGRDDGAMLEVGPEGGPYNALRASDGGSSRQSLIAITTPLTAATLTAGTSSPGVSAPGRRQEDDHNLVVFSHTAGIDCQPGDTSPALKAQSSKVQTETVVRRLTELECERLQGFPDDWTAGQSGSARYRQLGNSVAVPVVEWIAHRLVAVDAGEMEENR